MIVLIKIGFQKAIDKVFKANFHEILYFLFRKKVVLNILRFAYFLFRSVLYPITPRIIIIIVYTTKTHVYNDNNRIKFVL